MEIKSILLATIILGYHGQHHVSGQFDTVVLDDISFDRFFGSAIFSKIIGGKKIKVTLETVRKLTFEQDESCSSCGDGEDGQSTPTLNSFTTTAPSTTTVTTSSATSSTATSSVVGQYSLRITGLSPYDIYCYSPGRDVALLTLLDPGGNYVSLNANQEPRVSISWSSGSHTNYIAPASGNELLLNYVGGYFEQHDFTQTVYVYVYDQTFGPVSNSIFFNVYYHGCAGGTTESAVSGSTNGATDAITGTSLTQHLN